MFLEFGNNFLHVSNSIHFVNLNNVGMMSASLLRTIVWLEQNLLQHFAPLFFRKKRNS